MKPPTPDQVEKALSFYEAAATPRKLPSMLDLALSASASLVVNRGTALERYNPNPAGTIHRGSAAFRILECLRQEAGWRTEAQIRWRTGLSHSQTSFALNSLERHGKVQSIPDASRNTRYKRWRATPDSAQSGVHNSPRSDDQ